MTATRSESTAVANVLGEDGDVDWKAVIDLLREGKTAEIPCERERDYVRRSTQVVKRAENRGIAVEVRRGEGLLHVEPRPGAVRGDSDGDGDAAAVAESREELQLERHQQREARRAERAAERNREG